LSPDIFMGSKYHRNAVAAMGTYIDPPDPFKILGPRSGRRGGKWTWKRGRKRENGQVRRWNWREGKGGGRSPPLTCLAPSARNSRSIAACD